METKINNAIYEDYGDRWYTAYDDPIALLRAENEAKFPWILERIKNKGTLLDVGCGAGFLTNRMAQEGFQVTGVDLSPESLKVATRYDTTHTVNYVTADACHLPFPDASFEVVTTLDFLEHVPNPADVVKECARVLKPGGLFFYHTFNRNPLSHLVVIKLVEKLVKNTPPHMHVIELFIKPSELVKFCENVGLENVEQIGLRPKFRTIPLQNVLSGIVPAGLKFTTTKNLWLSYMGVATKL